MLRTLVVASIFVLACGEANYGDVLSGSETQASFFVTIAPATPEIFVAVVDDRPDAGELRAAVAGTFDGMDQQRLESSASCQPPYDPAAFHPVDRTVVVVHPSAAPEERYTTALDVPALSWRSDQRTDAEHAAWSEAVTAALEPKAAVSGAFAALAASEQVISLLRGLREPSDEEESVVVERTSESFEQTTLFYALAHDDESTDDPASYAVPVGNDAGFAFTILPAAPTPDTPGACFDQRTDGNDTARYAAWRDAQLPYHVGHWPCSDASFYLPLAEDCTGNCLKFAPVIESDGSALCTISAKLPDEQPCNAALGWLDPLGRDGTRAPQVVNENGAAHRVCEIRQLEGSALASCVSSLDCPDCEPGWCATQVPDLLDHCETAPNPFRFVGGADRAARVTAEIRCEAAP